VGCQASDDSAPLTSVLSMLYWAKHRDNRKSNGEVPFERGGSSYIGILRIREKQTLTLPGENQVQFIAVALGEGDARLDVCVICMHILEGNRKAVFRDTITWLAPRL
jgi:hypothetical protein